MLLVTGASGALGRLVLSRLADGQTYIAGSRTPERVDTTAADVRLLDFDDPATLRSAFDGAEVVLLISAGQGEDDTVIGRHGAAIDAAEQAGVQHIVYTSITGAGDHVSLALPHRWTERRLKNGRTDWTILRNGFYAELAVPALLRAAETGAFIDPMGDGRWSAVAREDLAEVAATVAQHAHEHRGRIYELVGERAVSGLDIADAATRAIGRPVAYRPSQLREFRRILNQAGLPEWQVPAVMSTFSAIAAGYLAGTESDLRHLLTAPPRDALDVMTSGLARL